MLSFEINGALVNIDLPDDTRLLWVVLDVLKLIGAPSIVVTQ